MTIVRYRFPQSGTAPASPAYSSVWESVVNATRLPLVTAPTNTPNTSRYTDKASASEPYDSLAGQWVGAPLATKALAGTFTLVMGAALSTSSRDAFLQCVIRVVSGDGSVVRGVLYAGQTQQVESATPTDPNYEFPLFSHKVRLLTGNLTPVAAQAGDRLVVEVGSRACNANTYNNSVQVTIGDSTSISDLPATVDADGSPTQGRPWIEFNFTDPPSPPTGLTQSDATQTSVLVSWTAPASGTAPTSYEYRVDGGVVTDVGLTTLINVTGLSEGTSYTFEVRSLAEDVGTSDWVSLVITTESAPEPPPPTPSSAQCFDPIRGSAVRVTGLTKQGRVTHPFPYAVSKSITRVQIREVTDSGNTEIMKNPEEVRRLRFVRPAKTIRYLVDIEFLRCEPSLFSLITNSHIVSGVGEGFGEGGFGEMPFGLAEGTVSGIDVGTHREPTSFGLEVWSKLAGQRCEDGSPLWGYTVFPHLRGGRITGVRIANGLVSFRIVGAQTRRSTRWGVGPHDLEGLFRRLLGPIVRRTGWRMQVSAAAPPEITDGILFGVDVLDNGTASDPMPDPSAPLTFDAGGVVTDPWIIDGGRP